MMQCDFFNEHFVLSRDGASDKCQQLHDTLGSEKQKRILEKLTSTMFSNSSRYFR